MPVSLVTLAAQLGAELQWDSPAEIRDCAIADVASLEEAGPGELTFLESERQLSRLRNCRAGAVLVSRDSLAKARQHFAGALLGVPHAHESFITAMVTLRPPARRALIGISPRAVVAKSARIGAATNVHPLACIGERVVIGEHCDIHPGVVIGDDCVIGDGVILYPNAVLYAETNIGCRVIIHASAVIGADGFGYRFVNGAYIKIPHTGNVRIEDDVEVGAGTTIDRAMMGSTVIGVGTKIDDQVMIGHNCRIGPHNAFASQVGFAGSTVTEEYVRCGGQAGISDHLRLGKGCTVGPKAGLHLDVPPGGKFHGMPAGPDKEQIRIHLHQQKLPEMRKELQSLLRRIAALEEQSAANPGPSAAAA